MEPLAEDIVELSDAARRTECAGLHCQAWADEGPVPPASLATYRGENAALAPDPSGFSVAGARELIRRWGRLRRLPDTEAQAALRLWAAALGVAPEVRLARIDPRQVTDHHGRRGRSLVGITVHERAATLYHTRRLMVEDLVHELLHVSFPQWSEGTVVQETARILGIRPCPRNIYTTN